MIRLEIGGTLHHLDEARALYQGAEGRLFRIPGLRGKLVKVYKTEADYPGTDANSFRLRQMARKRGLHLRAKLEALPKMPQSVIVPKGVILEGENFVRGFVLREVTDAISMSEFVNPDWRKKQKDLQQFVTKFFLRLHKIFCKVHEKGVVLGDAKPANILVSKGRPYLIDIESAGIGGFPATGFTWEYADPLWVGSPLLHEAAAAKAAQQQVDADPYDDDDDEDYDEDLDEDGLYRDEEESHTQRHSSWQDPNAQPSGVEIGQPTALNDRYSFAVMYFEARTGISPFSGMYFPKSEKDAVAEAERPLKGISCLHENVVLPRNGKALEVLNSTELTYFRRIFQKQLRTIFNLDLIKHRDREVAKAS